MVGLEGGERHAKLVSKRSKKIYSGPSVICKVGQQVDVNARLIVLGSANSRFGKPWYYIKVVGSGAKGWLPKKRIALQGKVTTQTGVKKPTDRQHASKQLAEEKTAEVAVSEPITPTPKYVAEASVKPQPQNKSSYKPPIKTPKFDPCKVRPKVTYYRDKKIWHVQEDIRLSRVPHAQCGESFNLVKGKTLFSIGETKDFYMLVTAATNAIKVGYFPKSQFNEQYIPKHGISKRLDVYSDEAKETLLSRAEYWNSWKYPIDQNVEAFKWWFRTNTGTALCLFSIALGTLLLAFKRSRRALIAVDQVVLRTGYFFVRSQGFWQMLRRLGVILVVSAVFLFALFSYVMWLKEVANYRQMAMGVGSLVLMSLSVGWFGMRVAGFFSGVILFFLSLIEFLMFVAFLVILFLAPSLLLLLAYYILYRRSRQDSDVPTVVF